MNINLDMENVINTFSVTLPMRANTSNKKKDAINLNVYRNLHHYSLNHQKKSFHTVVKPKLKHIPKLKYISIHYTICPKSKRRLDIMNVGSIIDKYFSDVLVECGIIPDDDYNHIIQVSFSFGGLTENECVIATISELNNQQEKEKMRILLDEHEIEEALNTYVESKGIVGATGVLLYTDDDNIVAEVVTGQSEVTEDDNNNNNPVDTTEAQIPQEPKKKRGRKPNSVKNNSNVGETNQSSPSGNNPGSSETTNSRITSHVSESSVSSQQEGKSAKNLFGDSDEGSSNNKASSSDNNSNEVTKAKRSIFDD